MYSDLKKIISEAGQSVNFAPYGEGVSDEWITAAEKRLNTLFPKSYIWWLKNYKGGEVFGEEIYSVYGMNFDTVVGGDIVYMNELERKNDDSFKNKLVISEFDDFLFYFDLSNGLIEGEYPVKEYFRSILFAESFEEFLKKRILNQF